MEKLRHGLDRALSLRLSAGVIYVAMVAWFAASYLHAMFPPSTLLSQLGWAALSFAWVYVMLLIHNTLRRADFTRRQLAHAEAKIDIARKLLTTVELYHQYRRLVAAGKVEEFRQDGT